MDRTHIVDWSSTLTALGIGAEYLTNRHGPCPGCGGKDRFRFDDLDGRGTWYCSGGGNPTYGDGYDLLRHVYGWTAADAFRAVRTQLGIEAPASMSSKPAKRIAAAPAPIPASSPTQGYALSIWARVDRSDTAVSSHPYAQAKRIDWHAGAGRTTVSGRIVGRDADCLVVPIREIETDSVVAVQCISASGAKQTFGPIRGNAFIIGNDLDTGRTWYVVEGWADACSMFRTIHGTCVFAAMGKEFTILAQRIAEHYRPQVLALLEDAP